MIKVTLKWIAPAAVTVLCGTSVALAMTAPTVETQRPLAEGQDVRSERSVVRLAQGGSIVTLDPVRVDDYWMSATLQPGGTLVFDGYAPDQAARDRFAAEPGADVAWLKLGRGEPESYAAHVSFGLSVLRQLSDGRFSLRENVAVVSGTAATLTDYLAVRAMRAQGAPQGMVLAMFDIKAPRANEYRFEANKASSGDITFSGFLPNPEIEALLAGRAGMTGPSGVEYASGEPTNFPVMAETALALLDRLADGKVQFDGRGWTLTGTPNSSSDREAIEVDFTSRQLAAAGWSMALGTLPQRAALAAAPGGQVAGDAPAEAAVAQAPLVVQPPLDVERPLAEPDPGYAFSVTRSAGGTAVAAGQLPSEATLRFLDNALAGANSDAVSIAPGAPPTFGASLQTGLRALAMLPEGALDFSEGVWRLSGTAPLAATEQSILALLAADPGPWETEIMVAAAEAEASVSPETAAPVPAGAEACETALAEFSARNSILFRSGAAIISQESQVALDELAADLALCPDALVHVEGHTDTDGDERLNLALSVARAEAVVTALIERGVAPRRLYALGFGESLPTADNATADGKRQNRRIVINLAGSGS